MKKLRKSRGFTLVELVIVIAVIAVLAAILVPTFSAVINNANKAKDDANARNMNIQLVIYKAEENVDSVDIHAAYNWLTANGHDFASSAKGYTYWLDTVNEKIVLAETEKVINGTLESDAGSASVMASAPLLSRLVRASAGAAGTAASTINDPGAVSLYPGWVLLDQREDDPIAKAVNGIRKLVENAGSSDKIADKFAEYTALLNSENETQKKVCDHLTENFDPATTVYITENGLYGGGSNTKNYYFQLGITEVKAISTTAVNLPAGTNVVLPVTLGLLMPGSLNQLGGTDVTVTVTNKNAYILPGALNETVMEASGIQPTVPEGQTAFRMETVYTQKEAVYLENGIEKSVRIDLADGKSTLKGDLSDYFDDTTGKTFLREYLIPSINFSSVVEGTPMTGIARVEAHRRVYGNIVSYYGVAYNKNGGVLAVSNEVGYVTDITVGVKNNNADSKEINGNWTIDVSNPERNFQYRDGKGDINGDGLDEDVVVSITVEYFTKADATVNGTATAELTKSAIGDFEKTVTLTGITAYSSLTVTKVTVKAGDTVVFIKAGESLAFNHNSAE